MTQPTDLVYHETERRLILNDDLSQATIIRRQEIPSDFWDKVAELKHVQDNAPVGDYLCVATLPELVIEKWFAEGFNIFDPNVTAKEVLARLRLEDKDRLITTSRQI